ncbi:homocysteine S-methyltransferase family protein [Marinomonas pollencensis]|uniref:Homocysteine S-methyltransferase n=1 Tax=Marinomonas pollencensis TaxID=491954 RepID=A0A3E0DQZ5_9GAMM|nr:homocysteine S-methyltransferase family protein [Marinomonas pollencensis]REG84301.1 homocysteine S-methyltransferase [Marinomonas pollencensis]
MKNLTILDGGMGRELKRMGAPFSQPYWSAESLMVAPQYVTQAHQGFIDAGAEIITTNSYACVPFHLGEDLYQERGAALAEQAAIIARDVAKKASQKVLVAGSLPPPFGSYRPDLFENDRAFDILNSLYEAQAPYVDLWLVETISSVQEAKVSASLLSKASQPCYYSFTLSDDEKEVATLRSGEPLSDALDAILAEKTEGIFFNCSVPEVIAQAIRETAVRVAESAKQINIGAYANSFAPIPVDHKANEGAHASRDLTPEEYLEFAKQWHTLGANIIGGCCGIGPQHIELLSQWQKSVNA